jgi:hypothetical protein
MRILLRRLRSGAATLLESTATMDVDPQNYRRDHKCDTSNKYDGQQVNKSFFQPMGFDPSGAKECFVEVKKPQGDCDDEQNCMRDGVGNVQDG